MGKNLLRQGCVYSTKRNSMKTITFTAKQIFIMASWSLFVFSSCSTFKEQGEPNETAAPAVITNDAQRQAIYERGAQNALPQNANPIPTGNQLRLNEKASETNRKKNIEEGSNPNAPSNTPTEERPRQMRNVGNDTIIR